MKLVAHFVEIARPNKEGIDVNDVVEMITGRPPASFEQFAIRKRGRIERF